MSAGKAVAKIAKPAMKGMHLKQIKRDVGIATAISFVASVGWYYAVNKPRRDNYAAFYKTYDAEADFQRMKAAGVFQSVQMIEEASGGAAEEEEAEDDE